MPNWCDCELTVRAKGRDGIARLAEFKRWVAGNEGPLSFDAVLPYPEKFKKMDIEAREAVDRGADVFSVKDGYNNGGYQWCIDNWGTKWDVRDVMLKENKDGKALKYFFQTAWSPPMPVVQEMGEEFPELSFNFRYFERGMGFQGVFSMEGGLVTENDQSDYSGHRGG